MAEFGEAGPQPLDSYGSVLTLGASFRGRDDDPARFVNNSYSREGFVTMLAAGPRGPKKRQGAAGGELMRH